MKQWISRAGLVGMLGFLAACGNSLEASQPQASGRVNAMVAGFLDVTFNAGSAHPGYVNTTFPSATSATGKAAAVIPTSIATQGRIVVAGATDRFSVVRLNNDGTIYTSFGATTGAAGKVKTQVGTGTSGANAVAVQSDGKIVAAGFGYRTASGRDFAMVRYNPDGTLDTTFGTPGDPGIVMTAVSAGSGSDEIYAIALEASGKIVAAGYDTSGTKYEFVVARYNTNGQLDTTFGTGGIARASVLPGVSADIANAVAIQSDGKIVIAGSSVAGITSQMALKRFTSTGQNDPTFASNGVYTNTTMWTATSLALQSTGEIVVGGSALGTGEDFAVARLTSAGALDTTFGQFSSGVAKTDIGLNNDRVYGIAIDSSGRIVAGGYTSNGLIGGEDFAVIRYTSTGGVDNGFIGGAKPLGAGENKAYGLAIDNNGKILLAGYTWTTAREFAVARVDP